MNLRLELLMLICLDCRKNTSVFVCEKATQSISAKFDVSNRINMSEFFIISYILILHAATLSI